MLSSWSEFKTQVQVTLCCRTSPQGVILPPQKHFTIPGDIWGCHGLWGEHVPGWHPVGRGQGCYYTSYNMQDGFQTKNYLDLNVSGFKDEKNCCTVWRYILRQRECLFPMTLNLLLTHTHTHNTLNTLDLKALPLSSKRTQKSTNIHSICIYSPLCLFHLPAPHLSLWVSPYSCLCLCEIEIYVWLC